MQCPIIQRECMKDECAWWSSVHMKNPVTQEIYVDTKCAVHTIAPMLVEIIKNTSNVQAAVETQRNQTAQSAMTFLKMFRNKNNKKMISNTDV